MDEPGRLRRGAAARRHRAPPAGRPALAGGLRARLDATGGGRTMNGSADGSGARPGAAQGLRQRRRAGARRRRGRPRRRSRRDAGDHGAERLREVDAAAPTRRPRPAERPASCGCAGRRIDRLSERALAHLRRRRDRLRLPGLPPDGRADRAGERRAAGPAGRALAAAGPRSAPRTARRGRARRPGRPPSRRRCPAASASASRSPGRWPTSRRSCWRTSRPATWTARRRSTCSGSSMSLRAAGLTLVDRHPRRADRRDGGPADLDARRRVRRRDAADRRHARAASRDLVGLGVA